jgi:hypothetical protein
VDVSRALIIPDFTLPPREVLASLALFWDSIEVPVHGLLGDPPPEHRQDIETLIEQGVLRPHRISGNTGPAYAQEAREIAEAWAATPADTTAESVDLATAEKIIGARARRVAGILQLHADLAVQLAADMWAAPLAASPFGFLASSLPASDPSLPIAEATLVHLAMQGAVVDRDTPIEAVLKFREANADLAGRLRAALGELAAQIEVDASMTKVAGQAEAVIKNRVEPALGSLEAELKRSRIAFTWANVLGLGGVLALGAQPTSAAIGSGAQLVGRSIRYAFDRDALVRDHPLGYLYKVRSSFIERAPDVFEAAHAPARARTIDMTDLLTKAYMAAYDVDPRSGFGVALVGDRSTDPEECNEYLVRWSGSSKEPVDRWWKTALPGMKSE